MHRQLPPGFPALPNKPDVPQCGRRRVGRGALKSFGAAGEWLLSSAHPTKDRVSLEPLKKAADRIPI